MLEKHRGVKEINNHTNTELLLHVLTNLFNIICRRTSRSYSKIILSDIIKTLENKFVFLKDVKISKRISLEHDEDIATFTIDIDGIDPAEIGKAIESIIRVANMNMNNKNAGLYFIKELKEQITLKYIADLKRCGVDLDLIQIEQHYLVKQKSKDGTAPSSYRKIKPKEKNPSKYASFAKLAWENVTFWEYEDNICTLLDKKGNVIEKLPLDKIVKDYIVEMTGFDEAPLNTDKLVELNEKEHEFIKLLYSRNVNAEEAMHLLRISNRELSIIIRKLLVYEILQYVSFDEVTLTEIGIEALESKK